MTEYFSADIRAQAAEAGDIILAQLSNILNGKDPEAGYRKAGLPPTGRVMVVIAYNGCETHDFAKLENKAKANNAKLYIINGNPEGADAASPSITFKDNGKIRAVEATIITPKKNDKTFMTPQQIVDLAGDLGLGARIDGKGTPVVISTGEKLFENGKPLEIKKAALHITHHAHARA